MANGKSDGYKTKELLERGKQKKYKILGYPVGNYHGLLFDFTDICKSF